MFQVLLIRLGGRMQHAVNVQGILTKYGCSIKVRLGLHEAGETCSGEGLIVLQLCDDRPENQALLAELCAVEGISARLIEI